MTYEPKILAFLCNWCSYAGADLAGISRRQYPPNVRVIRVMCSGRVDPDLIMGAYRDGVDGVIVGGCHPGDCHYISGNFQAEKKMNALHRLLEISSIDPKRFRLEWVSASEGERFASVIKEFTEQVAALGPFKDNDYDLTEIDGIDNAVISSRFRALIAKEFELLEKENVYGEKLDKETWERTKDQALLGEYTRGKILAVLTKGPLSVVEIAKEARTPPHLVLRHVTRMIKKGSVKLHGLEGPVPKYVATEVA